MKRNKPYSKEIIEEALAYLDNHSYSETSHHFNICKATLERWVRISGKSLIGRKLNKNKKIDNKIYEIPVEELKEVISNSRSYSNVLVNLGLDPRQHYTNHLKNRICELKLDTSCFEINTRLFYNTKGKPLIADRMKQNSNLSRTSLREYLIKTIKYECSRCKNDGTFMGEPLTLQVDHINGINNDNRLENLRFLCPNCHSQQPTSFGKNKKIIQNNMKEKKNHVKKERTLKFEVSKEELEVLVKEKPMTEIAKMFSVSDNAIKKRCKKLGIELNSMRGYWVKNKYGKE